MSGGRAIVAIQTAVSVRVGLALAVIEQRLGAYAATAGPALAAHVDAFVQREKFGYYPALEFFTAHPDIAPGLVAAVEQVGLFVCDYARTETRRRLWPVFSQVRIRNIQLPALTLPSVRPRQPDALALLARHYTPLVVRLDLILTSLEKGRDIDGMDKLAARKVAWWLSEAFATVDILDARAHSQNKQDA